MPGRRDEKLRHVKTNAARANQRHALAHGLAAQQHVDVAQHLGMVLPGDARVARRDAGGQQHFVKLLRDEVCRADACVQVQAHAGAGDAVAEVAQGFLKLFLAGHALGQVELAAYLSAAS
jgi:hypothetical protein